MANQYIMLENLAANGVAELLEDNTSPGLPSRLRFVQRPSQITFAIVANAVGIVYSVQAGDREVVTQSVVEAGGTTGVFPNLQEKAQTFLADAGEQLAFNVRETAAVATTDIMLVISVEPL